MTPDEFHKAALSLKGATHDVKWGADNIYSIGGKMFAGCASVAEGEDPGFSFKASDASFEMLIEEGVAIPAPYMARAKWVRLKGPDVLPDEQLRRYLETAHALTAAKLTKKARAELGLG